MCVQVVADHTMDGGLAPSDRQGEPLFRLGGFRGAHGQDEAAGDLIIHAVSYEVIV